jgi:hypothetical protein
LWGLFAYYQYAEIGFILTCRMPAGSGSGWIEEIIKATKDGVLIDGRGSYSIDQQRDTGQFGNQHYSARSAATGFTSVARSAGR